MAADEEKHFRITRPRPRRRWEDNIKMNLQELGCGRAWKGLIWLRKGTGGGHF